jgi:single-strand DNA-binding protein
MADNSVTIVGNLTREPELRFTNTGRGMAQFGVAVNRRWQNRQSGEWEEQVSFFNVTAWGDLGENCAASLGKGSRVIVNGRLEQRSYETQQGEKRSVVEIIADEVGPSLRWAQATVVRNERTGGEGGQSGGQPGGQQGGASSRPVANEDPGAATYSSTDEEPF